ncbi:MAG: RlmE family RNA methyltransferase [Candidatus Thermoplasmatota archaeon]
MSQTRWYQERSKEGYYRRAKKEGYRARSAYKLQQVNEKYKVLQSGDAVADLGCAPGGWLQVLVEAVGSDGLVIGVDLQRVKPVPGAKAIQGDFTKRDTHAKLAGLLSDAGRKELDTVVSDMAPDMSGNYDVDQFRSVHLSEMALDFATAHLKPGGHFVCKVFEGADFLQFRNDVKARFKSFYQFHPPASRKQSSEIYLVAKGFKPMKAVPAGEETTDAPKEKKVRKRSKKYQEAEANAADE